MRTRYNSQVQAINAKAMKDCLQHNRLDLVFGLDFGFKQMQVQKHRQME